MGRPPVPAGPVRPRPVWPWSVAGLVVAGLLWLALALAPSVRPTVPQASLKPPGAPAAGPSALPDQPAVPSESVRAQRPLTAAEQAELTYRHALSLIQQDRTAEAANVLATVLRLGPAHLGARQAAVALALKAGERERAETLLQDGLTFHRGDPWFHRRLGQVLSERGDHARAAEVLLAGLPHAGGAPDYLGQTGAALARLQRHEEAARLYTQAAARQPAHGAWWIGLGLSLEQLGRREAALQAYGQARLTRLSPEQRGLVEGKLAGQAGP